MQAKQVLAEGLQRMGLALVHENDALDRLVVYFRELKKWNRRYNLVAAKATDLEILEKHFLDSLTLIPSILPQDGAAPPHVSFSLLDVGSGAGFPGLVLKVACPKLVVTLVEPRQKRVSFLRHIIRTLGLKGVEVVCGRLGEEETTLAGWEGKFAAITSRALTDTASFLAMAARFCAPNGRIICMKGPKGLEEAKLFQEGDRQGPFGLTAIKEWRLPFSRASRVLLVFSPHWTINADAAGG